MPPDWSICSMNACTGSLRKKGRYPIYTTTQIVSSVLIVSVVKRAVSGLVTSVSRYSLSESYMASISIISCHGSWAFVWPAKLECKEVECPDWVQVWALSECEGPRMFSDAPLERLSQDPCSFGGFSPQSCPKSGDQCTAPCCPKTPATNAPLLRRTPCKMGIAMLRNREALSMM